MIHKVKDGERTLQFIGEELGHSSSKRPGKPRWVEFYLYKTQSNQYVISRIGYSVAYHNQTCATVRRNYLQPVHPFEIPSNYIPCETCKPHKYNDGEQLFPERDRPWAQVSQTARGVVESLMKYDDNDVAYLTDVARSLLEEASKTDANIRDAFMLSIID